MSKKIKNVGDVFEPVRKFGWKRDLKDPRDFLNKVSRHPNRTVTLPVSVDNSPYCSPIEDQGAVGSCTANSVAAILEYNDLRFGTKEGHTDVSRLFTYYATRIIDNTVSEDAGAYIRSAVKSVAKYGACPEKLWPYVENQWNVMPMTPCWEAASRRTISEYTRINDGQLEGFKLVLSQNKLIVFGFEVYDELMSHETKSTGKLRMPSGGSQCQGGHAVVLVGYDDEMLNLDGSKGAFKVRNSWGVEWGQKGYFWMPYAYVSNPRLSSDFWTIQSIVE